MVLWLYCGWRSDASTTYEGEPNPELWIMEALIQTISEETSAALVELPLPIMAVDFMIFTEPASKAY